VPRTAQLIAPIRGLRSHDQRRQWAPNGRGDRPPGGCLGWSWSPVRSFFVSALTADTRRPDAPEHIRWETRTGATSVSFHRTGACRQVLCPRPLSGHSAWAAPAIASLDELCPATISKRPQRPMSYGWGCTWLLTALPELQSEARRRPDAPGAAPVRQLPWPCSG